MSCCGGAEEEFGIPPTNQYNASVEKGSVYGGGGITLVTPFILFTIYMNILFTLKTIRSV